MKRKREKESFPQSQQQIEGIADLLHLEQFDRDALLEQFGNSFEKDSSEDSSSFRTVHTQTSFRIDSRISHRLSEFTFRTVLTRFEVIQSTANKYILE